MQRIREDSIGEVGLAEALMGSLLLKLNVNGLFPSSKMHNNTAIIEFIGVVADYYVSINENGSSAISFVWGRYLPLIVSDSLCIYDPFFNPNTMLNKIVKAALFISSIGDHMANVDLDWLAYGINTIVNGSNKIITKNKKWKVLPGEELKLNLELCNIPLLALPGGHFEKHFEKQMLCDFVK